MENIKVERVRKNNIDIARGIAIVCIVLGHLGNSDINKVVFTFHVPLFFLLTGYFMNEKMTITEYVKSRIRTLIVPYYISCMAIIVFALFFNQIVHNGAEDKLLLKHWVQAALYGSGDTYTTPFEIYSIGAIWFLWATFWGGLSLKVLLKLKAGNRLVVVGVIFFLSCWSRKTLFWFPLSIQAGGCALLFMYCGYLAKEILPLVRKMSLEIRAVLITFAAWCWIMFMVQFKSFWLVHCDFGRGIVDIIGSLCACSCVCLIANEIDKRCSFLGRGLAYLGRYSLIFLCLHIIELDTFPWWFWATKLFGGLPEIQYLWFRIIGKLLFIIPLTILCSKWKFTRWIFGYKEKNKI